MGCIMTPMPNHLSTYRSLPLNHIRVVMRRDERCGNGADEKWCGDGDEVEKMKIDRRIRKVEKARGEKP